MADSDAAKDVGGEDREPGAGGTGSAEPDPEPKAGPDDEHGPDYEHGPDPEAESEPDARAGAGQADGSDAAGGEPARTGAPDAEPAASAEPVRRRRRGLRWGAAIVAVLILVAGGTVVFMYERLQGNIHREHVEDQLGPDRPAKLNK